MNASTKLNAMDNNLNLMSGAAQSLSFQDLIDAIESLPLDDQSMLVEIINKRIIERRRTELAAEVKEAREAFSRGEVKRGTVKDLMNDCRLNEANMALEDSIEHDIVVRIPPKKSYIVKVDVISRRKAEPNVVEPNFK
jgi:hypothetical protein